MKKGFLKIAAMSLAAVLCMGALAGCGEKKDDQNQTNQNQATEAPKTDNELIMGTNAAFPPFEFVTSKGLVGQFDGIDIAIAKKIADKMGKELKIEDMKFEGLIAAVNTGKVDLVLAGMTIKPDRQESVDFSDPYFKAVQVMVVQPDSDITKAEDLKDGKKVGVITGYTGDSIVTENLKIEEKNITRLSRGIDAVQEVKNKKLDAVVIDSATGKALAAENGLKVVEDSEAFEAEEYAVAVPKGDAETLKAVNEVLKEMKESGEIDELAKKYNSEVEVPAE